MNDLFEPIDWERPWFKAVAELGRLSSTVFDWRAALNAQAAQRQILNHRGLPITFVDQSALPASRSYEAHISCLGEVPTRANLHDFFNSLVWLTFPQIKARLNALQAEEIERAGSVVRGKLRDAATLFDENAALLVVDDASWLTLLRAHAWSTLFVDRREDFPQSCDVWLFGHALMEKLAQPYKAITAHAWVTVIPGNAAYWRCSADQKIAWLDRVVAAQINENLTASDFNPLPVLGVPGWWPGQDATYYADLNVFRLPRQVKADAEVREASTK